MSTDIKGSPGDDCVAHFDDKAAKWTSLYDRACFADRLQLFVSSVTANVRAGARILDYGCGSGVLAHKLHAAGYEVTGVDASEKMVEQARGSAPSRATPGLTFRHIDPDTWPDTADHYDAIVCSSVLEYVDDQDGMLRKLSSRLAPGGKLIISVPNSNSVPGKLEDSLTGIFGRFRKRNRRDSTYCRRRYSASEFAACLDRAGLDTHEVTYFEMPKLGRLGIRLSRWSRLGVMMIVTGTRRDADA